MYAYMNSFNFDRFQETELPSQKDFYSSFNGEGISEKEHKHARKVWDTIEEYHGLYLLTDVPLLDEVRSWHIEKCVSTIVD